MLAPATEADIRRICASRGDHLNEVSYVDRTIICKQGDSEMLFTMLRVGDTAEVHVYCSPRHMRRFRDMTDEFVEKCKEFGINKLVTLTDKSHSVNGTVEKLGFIKTASDDYYDTYERNL